MPTRRKRHSVTETPDIAVALAPLRARAVEVRLGELIVLGAEAKLRQLDEMDHVERARQRLADRVRSRRVGADPEIADQARRSGPTRP